MSNTLHEILSSSKDFVRKYIRENFKDTFVYHSIVHTEDVVKSSIEIGKGCNLDGKELTLLQLAAWFHDVGYSAEKDNHEAKSIEIATGFLTEKGISDDDLKTICNAILATKMPQEPHTLLERVLCDADLQSLGSKSFFDKGKLLRCERKMISAEVNDEFDWLTIQVEFLQQHKYHTPFANAMYGEQKQKNLDKLNRRLNKEIELNRKPDPESTQMKKPTRGVETLFRLTIKNHTQLSAIADNKANIMLSINAIILSIVISTVVPNFGSTPELVAPTIILIFSCVCTIIFATLSTRPKITEGKFKRQDVIDKKANLVFFGNFYNMEMEEFEWAMGEVLKDDEFLYGSLKRDLFFLGKVLARKYKYLRITYAVFMYGIITSVLAYIAVFLLPMI